MEFGCLLDQKMNLGISFFFFFSFDQGGFRCGYSFEIVELERVLFLDDYALLVFRNSCIRKWFMNYLGSNIVKRVSQSFN